MREEGYYWVRMVDDSIWQVWRWYGREWWCPGDESGEQDSFLEEIDERRLTR